MGKEITTSSPTLWPIRAFPTGDSLLIFPKEGLASSVPVIKNSSFSPFMLTKTLAPNPTIF